MCHVTMRIAARILRGRNRSLSDLKCKYLQVIWNGKQQKKYSRRSEAYNLGYADFIF
jgi:hypothetical protein